MLNFLSAAKKQKLVGITLTPGIGLEVTVFDSVKKVAEQYGCKKVDYNLQQRDIQDYTQFKSALGELLDEMSIPPKSYAYIVLPNIYFNFTMLPSTLDTSEIENAILSDAEENFAFQKSGNEPVSGWCKIANANIGDRDKIAFSSFKKSTIDEIKNIISELGLQISGIETSYSATLRGLYATGAIDDLVYQQDSWAMVLINTNNFVLFKMEGVNLSEFNEIPLAIKSFSPEEAYQTIVSNLSQLFATYNTSRLYVVSQTDEISAEIIKKHLRLDFEIVTVDSNKYSTAPLVEVQSSTDFRLSESMTLSSIGAACPKSDFGLMLNVLANDPDATFGAYFTTYLMGSPVEVTAAIVQKVAIVLSIIIVVIFAAINLILQFFDNQAKALASKLNSESKSVEAQLQELAKADEPTHEVDMTAIIDDVAGDNVKTVNFFDSISSGIPKNVWLTTYYNRGGDRIAIRGIAQNIVDVYEYYKNLKVITPQTDIKLTELKVMSDDSQINKSGFSATDMMLGDSSDRLYSFEISNTQIVAPTPSSASAKTNEGDIIVKPSMGGSEDFGGQSTNGIEQPSQQMQPAG